MSTQITHAFVALSAGATVFGRRMPRRFWVAAVVCAVVPDLDVIGLHMGVPYESVLGHRGLTHGLPFAFVVSLLAARLALPDRRALSRRWWGRWAFLLAVAASHGLLDAMTDGGLGVAFFSPFSNARYFLPWRPLVVSPIGLRRFLSPWGAEVIASEIAYVWLPALGAFMAASWLRLWRRARAARKNKSENGLPAAGRQANNSGRSELRDGDGP